MKITIIIILIFFGSKTKAQELFVVSEPASNMPANSLGVRVSNNFMFENGITNYHLMPEIMLGVSSKLMLHLQTFHSNRNYNSFKTEGASIYAKYRFFSSDDIHKHFRMAFFGRYSINKAPFHHEGLETMGQNTGYEFGWIGSKLINKVAFSSSLSFEKAFNNLPNFIFPTNQSNNATNYTLSYGKLMYPKKYKNLNETNINLMCEFLGQILNGNGKNYLDIVPSIQFIIKSQARVDIAFRKEIFSNMARIESNIVILKFEYTFFNVLK